MLRFEVPRSAAPRQPHPGPAGADRAGRPTRALALIAALEALEADIALTKDVSGGRAGARPPRRASSATTSRSCCAPTIPGYVYFLEIRGRGVFLRASPIDVSTIVREVLLDRMTAHGADLGDADRRRLVRLRPRPARRPPRARSCGSTRSSTTRARRSSTCRAACPTRGRREFVGGGGARGRRDPEADARPRLRAVHELRQPARGAPARVEPSSSIRSSCRAPRRARRCCATSRPRRNAVLLATSSFWQGVDVVGEALSCVIIDKLPFASPGDPITAARIEAIDARGGSAFGEYQIPLASWRSAGARPPAPPPPGPRRAGGPRSAAAHDGLRPAVPGVAAAGAGHPRARRHRAFLRAAGLTPAFLRPLGAAVLGEVALLGFLNRVRRRHVLDRLEPSRRVAGNACEASSGPFPRGSRRRSDDCSRPASPATSSLSFSWIASPSRFCVRCTRNTIRKVTMVVPVLMTSCQVSDQRNSGPVTAQTTIGAERHAEAPAAAGPVRDRRPRPGQPTPSRPVCRPLVFVLVIDMFPRSRIIRRAGWLRPAGAAGPVRLRCRLSTVATVTRGLRSAFTRKHGGCDERIDPPGVDAESARSGPGRGSFTALAQTGQVKGKVVDAKKAGREGARSPSRPPTAWAGSSTSRPTRRGNTSRSACRPGNTSITATKDGLTDMQEQRISLDAAEVNFTLRAASRGGDMSAGRAQEGRGQERRDQGAFEGAWRSATRASTTRRSRSSTRSSRPCRSASSATPTSATLQLQKKDYDAAESDLQEGDRARTRTPPRPTTAWPTSTTRRRSSTRRPRPALRRRSSAPRRRAAPARRRSSTRASSRGTPSKIPEAKKAFEEAVKLDPKLAEAHYWLGHGQPERGQDARGGEVVRGLPEARRRPGKYAEQAKGILAQIKK